METRVSYIVKAGDRGAKGRVVVIVRVTEAARSGKFMGAEALLVLANDGNQRETVVEELFVPEAPQHETVFEEVSKSALSTGDGEYGSFDTAYIAARLALDLPISWTGPEDSRIHRELVHQNSREST